MANFCSISILNNFALVLSLEEKKNKLIVLDVQEIELEQLAQYLNNKKNFYIALEQKFEYSENIEVPTAIANSSNIRNYLLYKIKKANPKIDILFNFKTIQKQTNEENTLINVEAIDETTFLKSLSFIKDLSQIRSTTTNKFALLALANKCIQVKSYICVHTYAKTILIIAIENKELIFSRSTEVQSQTPETIQMDIAENITQTLSYINNQFREINFKTVALSGSIALDDVIPQHITMFSNVNISILYPNTFIENLTNEEPQEYILSLGSALVPKENRFVPKVIKGIQQFNLLTNSLLLLSLLLLIVMGYFSFNKFKDYEDLLQKNQILKHRYITAYRHTKMLSHIELDKYAYTIDMTNKYLDKTPTDILIAVKPLMLLDKPSTFQYKYEQGKISFTMDFDKQFSRLVNLYKFEKKFNRTMETISKNILIEKSVSVDYKNLLYKASIKTKKNIQHHKRERRQ